MNAQDEGWDAWEALLSRVEALEQDMEVVRAAAIATAGALLTAQQSRSGPLPPLTPGARAWIATVDH